MRVWSASWVAAGCILFSGCASNGPTSTFEELGQEGNTRGFGRLYPQDPNENALTLGVGDTVAVAVADTPELSGTHIIRLDGMITLPLLNEIEAAGLTAEQLRKKIELRLSGFMREPAVTVSIGQVQSKAFFIAANNPLTGGAILRKVPYRGDTVLLDVYAQMGSPSSSLDDDCHMKVIRGDPRNPKVYTVNVREIWELGYTGANIRIRPDDIIYVPPTWLGRLNSAIAGISAPFQSLFSITRSVLAVDQTVRIISGDSDVNGLGFGGFYGGGFGGGGFGGGFGNGGGNFNQGNTTP